MKQIGAFVAIVDDEEPIRKALLRLFRLANFRTEAFDSATALLQSLTSRTPDCVVLDLRLPDMSGLELLRRFSELDDPPPVVVITADDRQRTQEECLGLGVRHYLHKPIESDTLIKSVMDSVSGSCRPEAAGSEGA